MANIDKAPVQGGMPGAIHAGALGVVGCMADMFVINRQQASESFRESIYVARKLADGVQSDAARVEMMRTVESMHQVQVKAAGSALRQTLAAVLVTTIAGLVVIALAANRNAPSPQPSIPP